MHASGVFESMIFRHNFLFEIIFFSLQTANLTISKVTKIISAVRFLPREIRPDSRGTSKITLNKILKSKIKKPYFELQRLENGGNHEKPVLNDAGSNPGQGQKFCPS